MSLDDLVRDLVRQELARLLADEAQPKGRVVVDDVARARARAALRRLGVQVKPAGAKGSA